MLNFSLVILALVILIFQNILLLNEETLILLCFVVFCWTAVQKLGTSVYDDLAGRSNKIENLLKSSLNETLTSVQTSIKLHKKFQSLFLSFRALGNHFFNLVFLVTNYLPSYAFNSNATTYPKRFIFTRRLEQQTTKLLALLLCQKLGMAVSTKLFCMNDLEINYFSCFHKIAAREYIQSI
nr:ATP synthase B chain precursor [Ahnfeltia plicata]